VIKRVVTGAWLPDGTRDVILHPTAFAGWVGLLITMINLLPIGQLDGGHVAVAFFGNRYNGFSRRLHQALPLAAMAVFAWTVVLVRGETRGTPLWSVGVAASIAAGAAMPWMIWWGMVALVRRSSGAAMDHPPVDVQPLPPSRRALFWLMVALFALLLMPIPYRKSLAGARAEAPAAAEPSRR